MIVSYLAIWAPVHAPHFCVCQRKELHKNLESLLHTPPANRSQRSPCDLVSSCKRKKSTPSWTPSLLPGSNMAGQTESFQNIPLQPSALPFHLPSAALPRVRTQEPDNRLASRPPRETRPPPRVRQSKAVLRRLAGPSGPAPSLAVACGFPASSAAVGRAGRSCGHRRVAGACLGPQRSAGTVIPAASSMDFEDDYVHSTCRSAYQDFNGMDRDYGPGSYGGLAFKDIYLKILLLSASKAHG
eukprot:XP_008768183.1 PREDICTED: uncharacterized protein Zfp326 isoform X4 [Rattus norvegicus]